MGRDAEPNDAKRLLARVAVEWCFAWLAPGPALSAMKPVAEEIASRLADPHAKPQLEQALLERIEHHQALKDGTLAAPEEQGRILEQAREVWRDHAPSFDVLLYSNVLGEDDLRDAGAAADEALARDRKRGESRGGYERPIRALLVVMFQFFIDEPWRQPEAPVVVWTLIRALADRVRTLERPDAERALDDARTRDDYRAYLREECDRLFFGGDEPVRGLAAALYQPLDVFAVPEPERGKHDRKDVRAAVARLGAEVPDEPERVPVHEAFPLGPGEPAWHRVLIGDAGSGKSTVLDHLAGAWSDGAERVPLLIRLPRLAAAWEALVGVQLAARKLENQRIEAHVKCRVLNRMGELGMPRSERIPVD